MARTSFFALALAIHTLVVAVRGGGVATTITIASPVATLVGAVTSSTGSASIAYWNGIPYQSAPTGTRRLTKPTAITAPLGTKYVFGSPRPPSCPQYGGGYGGDVSGFKLAPGPDCSASPSSNPQNLFYGSQGNDIASEDCLTVNIQRPAAVSGLIPVVVWIHGGGYNGGTGQQDFTPLISRSVTLGYPILVVTVQYRLNGFGFLPGAQAKAAGVTNLGLQDQRFALQWVQDNIAAFSGDPRKVTVWGESAGAWSVYNQMAYLDGDNYYRGNRLFRAAIMNSGSALAVNPVDSPIPQNNFNAVKAASSKCNGATDPIACFRTLTCPEFALAAFSAPAHDAIFPYLPRPDGGVMSDSPDSLAKAGKFAKVPFIAGVQEDEGTLFARPIDTTNLQTSQDLANYMAFGYYSQAGGNTAQLLPYLYPDNSSGSPFRTGNDYSNIFPQYKPLAAIIGDLFFIMPRRILLSAASSLPNPVKTWSYQASYVYQFNGEKGTSHGSDIGLPVGPFIYDYLSASSGGVTRDYTNIANAMTGYYISFFHTMDPNGLGLFIQNWPEWRPDHKVLNVEYPLSGATFVDDTQRNSTFTFLLGQGASLKL